jgi:hypothetical protein
LFQRFRIAPRLTAHVRHRHKYADVPVRFDQEFVFTQAGRPTGTRARTVRDLLSGLTALPDEVVQSHLARGDFRRWFEDVFGDRELAGALQQLERGDVKNVRATLLRAIADRYGGRST